MTLPRLGRAPALIGGRKVPHTISACLVALGLPRSRVYVSTSQRYDLRAPSHKRSMHFWAREADHLEEFAAEAKRAFHRRLREVRTDLPENHEAALWLLAVYRQTKRLFRDHGVTL